MFYNIFFLLLQSQKKILTKKKIIMAKITRGILGGFKGSVANIVGTSWKGIAVMKSKPLSVANPRTAKQVKQRNKFSIMTTLTSVLLAVVVKPFWDKLAQQMTGANVFLRTNIDAVQENGTILLYKLVMSTGSIGSQEILTSAYDAATKKLTLTWNGSDTPANGMITDVPTVVMMSETGGVPIQLTSEDVQRDDGSITIDVQDEDALASTMGSYLFFKSADGERQSETYYKNVTLS